MKHYDFPYIETIDDIASVIKGRKDFRIMDQGNILVVCYMVTTPETFMPISKDSNGPILRECRGITFDKATGKIISRPYHKFKNLFEDEEHQEIIIDQPHSVLTKEDGSMVHAFKINGKLRFATKKGFSEVAAMAEKDLRMFENVENLINHYVDDGYTPIFEYVGRQKIVIEYGSIDFILTAIRHRNTGKYFTYDELGKAAQKFGVTVVQPISTPVAHISDLRKFSTDIDALVGLEGVVVRYDNGHMFKAKAEDYRNKHQLVGKAWSMTREKNVISALVNDYYDDLIPNIPAQMLPTLNLFASAFWTNIRQLETDIKNTIEFMNVEFDNDKDKNKYLTDKVSDKMLLNFYRACWRSYNTPVEVLFRLLNDNGYLTNGVRLEKISHFWGSLTVDQFADEGFKQYKGIVSDAEE